MRALKLCVVLGLVAVFCSAAGAVTLPSPYVWMKGNNYDSGTVYFTDEDPDTYDATDFPIWDGTGTPPTADLDGDSTATTTYRYLALGRVDDTEDSWGLISMASIYLGVVNASSGFITDAGYPAVWNKGDNDEYIVGIFWGLDDDQVTINSDRTWDVTASGLEFELWLRDSIPSPPTPTDGTADRTAYNRYDGWIDGSDTLLMVGETTVYGFSSTAGMPQIEGQTTAYLKVDPTQGLWGPVADTDFYGPLSGVAESDIYLSWQTGQSGTVGDFNVFSSDEMSFAVPEPVSILSVVMGLGGLASYLRRRHLA